MRYLDGGATLKFHPERCNGCGLCARVCPHAVFALVHQRAVLADRPACIECGACALNCEPGAIEVRAGVGCAAAFLGSLLDPKLAANPSCGCSGESSSCC